MKTRIANRRNTHYELVIDDGSKGDDLKVLAGMTLFEGTGCWMLTDIRLHQHRTPSPYSGDLLGDDVSSHFKPKDAEESAFVQSLLREFLIEADGSIHWSTFEGLVRGQPRSCSWSKSSHNGIGYFSRAEGLARLKEIQKFWDAYEGDPADAKIDNPNRQPNAGQVYWRVLLRREVSSA